MSYRQELIDSIHPEMKLNKAFFRKIYAYSIYHPEFADEVIKVLIDAGCSKAKVYYDDVVSECRQKQDEAFKAALPLLRKMWKEDQEKYKKGGVKNADGGKTQLSYGLPQDW